MRFFLKKKNLLSQLVTRSCIFVLWFYDHIFYVSVPLFEWVHINSTPSNLFFKIRSCRNIIHWHIILGEELCKRKFIWNYTKCLRIPFINNFFAKYFILVNYNFWRLLFYSISWGGTLIFQGGGVLYT